MIKLGFFDVDGVLSAPCFVVDGEPTIGLPTMEGWLEYCEQKQDTLYDDCKPVPVVLEHAKKLKEHGARLYVLTASSSETENRAKAKFVERHYPGIFEDIICVASSHDKIPVIIKMAEEKNLLNGECELLEDTYTTLLDAQGEGIVAVHIANLLA